MSCHCMRSTQRQHCESGERKSSPWGELRGVYVVIHSVSIQKQPKIRVCTDSWAMVSEVADVSESWKVKEWNIRRKEV